MYSVRIPVALFLLSLATLATELTLIRVFDVVLTSNTAYIVVTCALFGFGVAGAWRAVRPLPSTVSLDRYCMRTTLLLALSLGLILPLTNLLPFNYRELFERPVVQFAYFSLLLVILGLPFFYFGLLLAALFERFTASVSRLYFWDLAGAALGCIIVAPLFPSFGPGGVLLGMAGLACIAAGLFAGGGRLGAANAALGAILVIAAGALPSSTLDFVQHMDKRGVKKAQELSAIEFSRWDPISKIEVYDSSIFPDAEAHYKHVAYDGGMQSSYIFPFDGDFENLRYQLENGYTDVRKHFWQSSVAAAHHLKADSDQRVLVLGSAGGQETKAALLYGARHVDAVEMVGTVVKLGLTTYSAFNGGIFRNPRVNAVHGEGRSFLRASDERYDVIQIFSNHTSSSIASGVGAMQTSYTQTAEAYREYFEHLTPNGVLQVNHHIFPRMVATAALGWKQAGLDNFQAHVAIWQRPGEDFLPTMMIKRQPWTQEELDRVEAWFALFPQEQNRLMVNPLRPGDSFLSEAFFTGSLPQDVAKQVPFRVQAATDDRPFFNFNRKHLQVLQPDPANYLDEGTAAFLNSQMKSGIPFDQAHLYVTAAAGLVFATLMIGVPMIFSRAGRTPWSGRRYALLYFACLGCGFIMIEMVLIQKLMRLIGSPLHTSAIVIGGILLSAACGSLMSRRLGVLPTGRWQLPFLGVVATLAVFLLIEDAITAEFLRHSLVIRCLAAVVAIAPIGFFLGMPFPLGIVSLNGLPAGAIAWCWSMNAVFTVLGGVLSIVLSLLLGFEFVLLIALAIYVVAALALMAYRRVMQRPSLVVLPLEKAVASGS